MTTATLPEPGQIVRVRARQYLVEEVAPHAPPLDTRVRMSCVDDDAQGEELEVLWEREVDAELRVASWQAALSNGFDDPKLFSAWLHTLRWNCVTSTRPELFQAPWRAGIEVKAYQLEPLRKALKLPRVNLFIADDVGLGKTIEAGLILRELLMRQKVRRVVICAPPSVVVQWREEMSQRFGLGFAILDREYVATCRRDRGFGVNPWTTHSRFILSHALLRDEAYAAPLRDWLEDFAPSSLLILDEAHNAAPASSARIAVDSQFTLAVRDIAKRFEHRLFLSATPHNGHSNSFAALLEILDPQRFCRGVPVTNPKILEPVMVRRLKEDIRAIEGGFPLRIVDRVPIRDLSDDAPELVLSRKLAAYRDAREARLAEQPSGEKVASALVLVSLQKRLLSSFEAFARTLRVHRRAIEQRAVVAASDALLHGAPSSDDDRADLPEAEVEAEEEASVASATAASHSPPSATEVALLREMIELVDAVRHLPDARVRWLHVWLRANLLTDGRWNQRRVVIFTEYADTKRYLVAQLESLLGDLGTGRILTFHGGMNEVAREDVKKAFNASPDEHPVRILVATDAAREGVNLQNHCADLIHFDLPWNPSRMEQRNGRIDRKLQRAAEVRCHYFVLPQRAEDRVLEVLVERTKTIRDELGVFPPLLDSLVEKRLAGGIRHADANALAQQLRGITIPRTKVDAELGAVTARREGLLRQFQDLDRLLAESKVWLGLDDDAFRDAVSASLRVLGAPSLRPKDVATAVDDPARTPWEFPALDRTAAGRSWEETLDALREPKRRDQRFRDWRREAKLRPIVFRDPGSLDGHVVHLHLEHRVVQRLLGRFLAQGFVHDDLSRAAVVLTDDPTPYVLVLGRLSLYGAHAARLHDEVLIAAAPWVEPELRIGKLQALGDDDRRATIALLEEALGHARPAADETRRRLAAIAPRDVDDLTPHLKRRANKLAREAEKRLKDRGEKEAAEMLAILTEQKKRIEETLARWETPLFEPQLDLYTKEEEKQVNAEKLYQQARLKAIPAEMEKEPARIRATYAIAAEPRVEPIGIVYLWPRTR